MSTPLRASETPSQKDVQALSASKHRHEKTFSAATGTPDHKRVPPITQRPTTSTTQTQGHSLLSSSKKKTKMKHSQLKHILDQEKKSKKSVSSSSLHSFLSSL
jgi:hypothetical protein